jgi:hypothetical protein
MFAFQKTPQIVEPKCRPQHGVRRTGLILACGLALLAGGCAHNGGDAPALQWQFGSADSAPGPTMYSVEPVERSPIDVAPTQSQAAESSAASTACGSSSGAGWSDRCYVYRGGRDPKTGLAYSQL